MVQPQLLALHSPSCKAQAAVRRFIPCLSLRWLRLLATQLVLLVFIAMQEVIAGYRKYTPEHAAQLKALLEGRCKAARQEALQKEMADA